MRPLLFLFLPSAALALNLTPEPGYREMEGFKIPVVRFTDTTGKVRWSPPQEWQLKYESGILSAIPRNLTQASFEIRVVARTSGDREILTKLESLQAYCAKFLPASAKGLTYRSTSEGVFTIGPTPAREYVFDYTEPGMAYKASVMMVDLSDRERLVCVVTTRAKDYESVRTKAVESMFSWQSE